MDIKREDRNLLEVVSCGYWIIIDPNGVVVSDNETCEEIDRFDWSNIKRLLIYSPVAYEKAMTKFEE